MHDLYVLCKLSKLLVNLAQTAVVQFDSQNEPTTLGFTLFSSFWVSN